MFAFICFHYCHEFFFVNNNEAFLWLLVKGIQFIDITLVRDMANERNIVVRARTKFKKTTSSKKKDFVTNKLKI